MKKILLISIGKSPLLIFQSTFYPHTEFDEIHAIGTEETEISEELCFSFQKLINKPFDLHKVSGSKYLNSENEWKPFEEACLRWALSFYAPDSVVYYCTAGGMKHVSSCLHRAAESFGAIDTFHMLAHPNPGNTADVISSFDEGKLKFISQGPSEGWHSFRFLHGSYVNNIEFVNEWVRMIVPPKKNELSDLIRQAKKGVVSLSVSNAVSLLPFNYLALLSSEQLNWLQLPVDTKTDLAWLYAIPKVDLHTHLGGFATKGPLLSEVRNAANNAELIPALNNNLVEPAGWPYPDDTITLDNYMHLGDNTGSAILFDTGCLRKHVQLLYKHLCEQNVIYAEVRCSPYNYSRKAHKSALEYLQIITSTFEECMQEFSHESRCHVNLLIIATRKEEGDLSDISKHLALAITVHNPSLELAEKKCEVVGVDLAGFEIRETRAQYFQYDFTGVHRCGLAVTAHAGENDDAEGIWQAVYKLHTRRIGHGLRLNEAPDLKRAVIERRIGLELCPMANYQIVGFKPMNKSSKIYPLKSYLDEGVLVSINTDNIGISEANISDNFLMAARMNPSLTRMDVLRLIRNGIETAFISNSFRNKILQKTEERIFQSIIKFCK
jgi:adenosine deaminase